MRTRSLSPLLSSLLAGAFLSLASTGLEAQNLVANTIGTHPASMGMMPPPSIWPALAIGALYLVSYRRWKGLKRAPGLRRPA